MTTANHKPLTDRIHPAGHFGYAYPFDLLAVDGLTPAVADVQEPWTPAI